MSIAERLDQVRQRIRETAMGCGREPSSIRLVAVTKTVSPDQIRPALAAGADILGENYIQEALKKMDALAQERVSWHFIGHLQSNKAKYAVRGFDLIHSVDSLKLALELNKQAEKINKVQDILVQVNISLEPTKSGVAEADALSLIQQISPLEHIAVKGLMTMPPFFDAPEKVRPYFKALADLKERIKAQSIPGVQMNELSMGMTGDFEAAISEGATLVRIGTAIFGKRQ